LLSFANNANVGNRNIIKKNLSFNKIFINPYYIKKNKKLIFNNEKYN